MICMNDLSITFQIGNLGCYEQPILLEVEGVAYNEAYPSRDSFIVRKVYSNEFYLAALEEVLKILAFNVGMAYVVDQA